MTFWLAVDDDVLPDDAILNPGGSGVLRQMTDFAAAEPGCSLIAAQEVAPDQARFYGIVDGTPVLDLPYIEDSRAEVDMNVVMTSAPGGSDCKVMVVSASAASTLGGACAAAGAAVEAMAVVGRTGRLTVSGAEPRLASTIAPASRVTAIAASATGLQAFGPG